MKPEIRINRLLNQLKKKYDIKDRIKIRIIKKEFSIKGFKPFMTIYCNKTPIIIEVFINNVDIKFDKISDGNLKKMLAHELVHLLCKVKSKDPEVLIKTILKINHLIDER